MANHFSVQQQQFNFLQLQIITLLIPPLSLVLLGKCQNHFVSCGGETTAKKKKKKEKYSHPFGSFLQCLPLFSWDCISPLGSFAWFLLYGAKAEG